MGRQLYVGDISVSADDSEIRQLFSMVGTVETINVVSNHRVKNRRRTENARIHDLDMPCALLSAQLQHLSNER